MYYHVDGDLVPREDAVVSADDRGVIYGDGITERLRAYGGTVFEWEAHEQRIEKRCAALSIPVPGDLDLRQRIIDTLAANDCPDAFVRVSITRGGGLELLPAIDATPTVVIAVEEAPRGGRRRASDPDDVEAESASRDGGEGGRENGTEDENAGSEARPENGERATPEPAVLGTVTIRRPAETDPLTERSVRLRARLELARAATDQYRPDEALVRDAEGHLTGGTRSDVLFVDNAALHVPTADPVDVLRPVVCEIAREESVPVERGQYSPSAVREASEAFLVSTTEGLRPIARLDGIAVGDGPVRKLLSAMVEDLIERRHY